MNVNSQIRGDIKYNILFKESWSKQMWGHISFLLKNNDNPKSGEVEIKVVHSYIAMSNASFRFFWRFDMLLKL